MFEMIPVILHQLYADEWTAEKIAITFIAHRLQDNLNPILKGKMTTPSIIKEAWEMRKKVGDMIDMTGNVPRTPTSSASSSLSAESSDRDSGIGQTEPFALGRHPISSQFAPFYLNPPPPPLPKLYNTLSFSPYSLIHVNSGSALNRC